MPKLDESVKDALAWEVQDKAVDLFVRRWKFRLGLATAVAVTAMAVIGFNLRPWMDKVAEGALQSKIDTMSVAESGAIRQIKLEQAIALQSLVVAIEQARAQADAALLEVKALTPKVEEEAHRLDRTRESLDKLVASMTYLQENTDKLPVVANALRSMDGRGLEYEGRLQRLEATKTNAKSAAIVNPHPGIWGNWTAPKYCPPDQYVCGSRVRFESRRGSKDDDTALNSVELQCCPF